MPILSSFVNAPAKAYGFTASSGLAYETLTLTASATLTVTGNGTTSVNAFKTSGSTAWDSQFYTATGYTAPVTLEFNKLSSATDDGVSYAMISLNADPTTDASYVSLDWAAYPYATNTYSVYHNGSGLTPSVSTWSTASKWYIVYGTDGFIRHYNGATQMFSANKGVGGTVYIDASIYSVNATKGGFSNIRLIRRAWNGTAYV